MLNHFKQGLVLHVNTRQGPSWAKMLQEMLFRDRGDLEGRTDASIVKYGNILRIRSQTSTPGINFTLTGISAC